jgi:hypothetical protein
LAFDPSAGRSTVYRLDPDGVVKTYPFNGSGIDEVLLSPKGNIWVYDPANHRYDSQKDAFVAGEPWDEFAFEFAKRNLAMLGSQPKSIYIKTVGQWHPWEEGQPQRFCMVHYGRGHSTWRERVLTRLGRVVAEYDAATGELADLADAEGDIPQACFDRLGRVIIFFERPGPCALVYEGDPFRAATPPNSREPEFNRLLAQLDDPKWPVREATTAKLRRDTQEFRPLLAAALARPNLSAEARTRLEPILADLQSNLEPKPGLFERMHPPLLTPANR